jgi:acyl-CoA thioester hydrolase
VADPVSETVPAGAAVLAGAAANGAPVAETAAATGRKFVFQCPLRWGDMDSFGHVNNVVYLRYLEQARVEWMFTTAKQAGVGGFTLGTVVARHEIEYKRPLVYRAEPVTIESWVTRIGTATFTIAYEVKDAERVYATAATVLVPYDLVAGRPRRITAEERRYLEAYLIPATGEHAAARSYR